ncbi:lysophospholipase NTE1 [Dichotomopilus funicola]|uniref:Lysophospholipase NTE1 n=1 Tax=Dichotomopilus funicola TaxID=1934379 RepID=A0AAN6ZQ51_9PEZI|nr:lysophospholipase NTE1 [Dichotomopilus funicola]
MDVVNSTALAAASAAATAVTTAVGAGDRHPNPLSSAVAVASDVANAHSSSSWLGMFARLVLWILQFVSMVLYYSIKLATISVPTLLYTLFSTSLTVTMNATTLMLIVAAMIGVISWVVRYRYLNMYSRLPPEPQRKEPDVDLFPDTHDEGIKSGLSNYFDEFLSAIKIFGYLERPVFHELTRSMQTRKLIAGETFNLEEEKGFCLVVDGLVEIFVKSSNYNRRYAHTHSPYADPTSETLSSDDEHPTPGQQRYQLLTEVRNGAPMSSLFSIMSLFTEDVPLRHAEEDSSEPGTVVDPGMFPHYPASADFRKSHVRLNSTPNTPQPGGSARTSAENLSDQLGRDLPRVPPISLDGHDYSKPQRPAPKRSSTTSAHPDIIARATVDTTIAIIPASAFRRLIKVYPKATAHIVHVILSRFQRVTLATAYSYLGLTGEVLHIERQMLKYTTQQLPNHLRGDALDRLKEKFKRERERIGEEDVSKGIALHNAHAGRRRRSTATLRKEAALQSISKQRHLSMTSPSLGVPSAGDLVTHLQQSRGPGGTGNGGSSIPSNNRAQTVAFTDGPSPHLDVQQDASSPLAQRSFNPFATPMNAHIALDKRDTLDEDNLFRESILACMFRAVGLTSNGIGGSNRDSDSNQASPRLISLEQRRQKALYTTGHNIPTHAFGFMDALDGSADGDTESLTSAGLSVPPSPNPHLLAQDMRDDMEIVFFPKGSVLVEQGERNPGLYYVIDGFLDICTQEEASSDNMVRATGSGRTSLHAMDNAESLCSPFRSAKGSNDGPAATSKDDKTSKANRRRSVALIKPGGLAGYVGTISSYRSFIEVVAKTDVYVGFLPLSSIERIVDRYPIVLLTMAKRLTNLLPRLILHIDFALEWLQVNAGQVIFHEGDESEAIYIVLNGRLRLVEDRKDGGGMNVKAEFGQGESIGELEVLTETSRSGTLHAIRETELVKFPRTLFNSLAQEHPNITIKISKIIASRMRALIDDPSAVLGGSGSSLSATSGTGRSSINKSATTLNLRTVAVLPVSAGVPVVEFGNRLLNALTEVGAPNGATSLNSSAVLNHLGRHAFSRMGKLKLSQYLADLEEKYGLVIYVAVTDTNVNAPWTQTCIAQADCVLLVGLADGSPEMGEYERFMLGTKSTARKILVMVHQERYSAPGLTRKWLKNRVWINGGHFHVQMTYSPNAVPIHRPAKPGGPTLRERVQILQAEIQKYTSRKVRHNSPFYSPDAPFKGDFHRLARRLCGKSVGLVLGGGGARGLAQIGIIRAMQEAGIPIDIVGGTSIGAFVGALYARHADFVPIVNSAKKFSGRMASMWRFALDLTYPSASYTTGHEFNRGIFKAFGNTQIEDFWLEYYCNTTNISQSRAEFHTSGYAWRYVRASMSLAGLLPPLCDEGSMLLDGGYVDNLTVSHMKSLGSDLIFAIDVGALDDNTPQSFGDSLSGMWAFFNRWNPFSSVPNPPTLAEIQARLAYVSSVDALERAKSMPGCVYMRPPIDEYGTLDFGKFMEIYGVGYKYGQEFLAQLRERGVLPVGEEMAGKKALRRTMAPRRASI